MARLPLLLALPLAVLLTLPLALPNAAAIIPPAEVHAGYKGPGGWVCAGYDGGVATPRSDACGEAAGEHGEEDPSWSALPEDARRIVPYNLGGAGALAVGVTVLGTGVCVFLDTDHPERSSMGLDCVPDVLKLLEWLRQRACETASVCVTSGAWGRTSLP